MGIEDFKSVYENAGEKNISKDFIKKMTKTGNHPVLKRLRLQLIFETVVWAAVLIVFYDIFDGHLKVLAWNVAVVVAILLLLVHNLLGYKIIQYPIQGESLKASLNNYLAKIKTYAWVSIGTRVIAVATLMLFLTSTSNWTEKGFGVPLGMLSVFALQVYLLGKVWKTRIEKIKTTYEVIG
ncbi:hypothetical protein R9C00_01305 [Flammeovirgaceae bacterium SG7u.111]|nr:hypothetical protein [Flammeovirgaceae bacterium SG7u.132]WPO36085.1 hypothetical protein R9C00_01305 [Flammeovirgaceae bacterium SG7u.111]